MRFLADMGVSLRVVEWLRSSGHDTIHLRDEGLQKMPNGEIVAANGGSNSVGVILFRLRNTRADYVVQRLNIVLQRSTEELAQGAVVLVEDERHRVRRMPIGK
jgi:predicted nuclease of predicted toxin-antitoxin system